MSPWLPWALSLVLGMAAAAGEEVEQGAGTAQAPDGIAAGPVLENGSLPQGQARVTYVTTSSAYIDAGRQDGLEEGDLVQIMRGGEPIAVLKVSYLASNKASCTILESSSTPVVGDAVAFRRHERLQPAGPAATLPGSPQATAGTPAARRKRSSLRDAGLRGRVGVRYLFIRNRDSQVGDYSAPSLDMRLDGFNVGGSPLDLSVDMRARRVYRTRAGSGSERDDRNRVYRLAVSLHDDASRYRLTAGRQYSATLATVSIFDGLLFEFTTPHWSTGAFTGTQPDPVSFGLSSAIREHGVFLQAHNKPSGGKRWSITSGLIGSYTEGEVNREFLYLQGIYGGKKLSTYFTQEIDYNRAWKVDAGEDPISPTSTFASVRYRVVQAWDMHVGYDNRRNVRLYRDLITPETEFDDTFRQGAWVGTTVRMGRHFASTLDARSSSGGTSGSADSQTLALRVHGLTRQQLEFRTRSTHYTNDRLEGWLHSLGVGLAMGRRYHLQLTGGVRDETALELTSQDNTLTWIELEQDILLGRSWYLLLSAERDEGDLESNNQFYASLTYRF